MYSMMGMAMQIHQPTEMVYHADWHPTKRVDRFPSVEERVKLYMSIWHQPPCEEKLKYTLDSDDPKNYTRAQVTVKDRSYTFHGVIQRDLPLYLDPNVISDCTRGALHVLFDRKLHGRKATAQFIADRSINRPLCADLSSLTQLKPGLATLGKERSGAPIPIFGPWRRSKGKLESSSEEAAALPIADDNSCLSKTLVWHPDDFFPPIIWRLSSRRQYDLMARASNRDFPWERKLNKAVWRSTFADMIGNSGKATEAASRPTTKEACMEDSLCRLVFQHAESKLVDAGYGPDVAMTSDKIDGVKMLKRLSGLRTQQYCKILIHFEGNDYGASLGWKLYSRSVLLMPPPTRTTWFMEELLEPWVHYLPLNDTNAEDMVRWVEANDEKAQQISERATLFAHDLLLHPKAMDEEEEIKREMRKRYQAHWQ
jgi:hypothetical protein